MKLSEIAARIDAHFKRIEPDEKLNPCREFVGGEWRNTGTTMRGTAWLCRPSCLATGTRIRVSYVSYQCTLFLSKDAALAYLAWLDAGNLGSHHVMERQARP